MSLSPERLQELFWSFREVRVALTAIELDVFAHLGDGSTAQQLAERIHTNPRATEMLLNALVNLELLTKQNDRFFNTELSTLHLTGDGRMAIMHQVGLWDRWSSLTDCVRAGKAVIPHKRDEAGTEAFIAAMHRNASERAQDVVSAVEANKSRDLLDLGGGSGAYSIALAQANPQLHATILDHEPVLKIAARHIANAGVTDRVHTRVGDMLDFDLDATFDLVLLSQVLHMFTEAECSALLRRVHQALVPGGRVAIQEFILDPEKTSPRWAVLFSLNMLVGTAGGASYSAAELSHWLAEAGFKNVRHVPLGHTGLMLAEK
jgi:ubiquinone/menaquinone biosynthesis C-methylase UbiE